MARYRLGTTSLTWTERGIDLAEAVADAAALGFAGFETFASLAETYPSGVGRFREALDANGLPLVALHTNGSFIEPAKREADFERVRRHARLVKSLGGGVVALTADGRRPTPYSADEYAGMVRALNEAGQICLDEGLILCLHPHAGTPIESREEIDRVVGSLDPHRVFLAPDTGHIAKGGGDPVAVYHDYRSMIRYVHLKDYVGGKVEFDGAGKEIDRTGHRNFVPLGEGVVDFGAVLDVLDEIDFDGYLMAELNWTPSAAREPRACAAIAKSYLDGLLAAR